MIHVDVTTEERRQFLAVEIEHGKRLLADARKCKLPKLVEQRRQRIVTMQRELRQLNQATR